MTPTAPPRLELTGHQHRLAPGEAALVTQEVADLLSAPVAPSGSVLLDGRDVSAWDAARRARAGLVVLGGVTVAEDVSIRDHLVAVDAARADELLAQAPLLVGRGDDPAGWLSGGERQVLGWLQTILAGPRAVLLDVAGRGLDGPTLAWAGTRVAAWREAGVAVLVHAGRPEEEPWARAPR